MTTTAPGGSAGHSYRHGSTSSTALGYQHGPRWQPRSRVPTWPSRVIGATNINSDPGCHRAMAQTRASAATWMSPWHQVKSRPLRWWQGPWTPTWPQVAAQTLYCLFLQCEKDGDCGATPIAEASSLKDRATTSPTGGASCCHYFKIN